MGAFWNGYCYSPAFNFSVTQKKDLFLPVERKTEFLPVAIHTRLGKDGPSQEDEYAEDENEDEGFFSPNVEEGKDLPEIPHYDSRHWSVIAKTGSPTEDRENYTVKLYLIPHGWSDPNDDIEDEDALGYGINEEDQAQECGVPFYLTTEIILPEGYRVLDMSFYGDDGRSNLSSGLDSGTGRERRQGLGLLLGNGSSSGPSDETIELWLLKYDALTFQVVPAKKDSKQVFLDDSAIDSQCQAHVQPAQGQEEEEEPAEQGVLFAKSKFCCCTQSSYHLSYQRILYKKYSSHGFVFAFPLFLLSPYGWDF
jgi:hypothetical protein